MNILVVKGNNRPEGVSTKMYETFLEALNDAKDLTVNTFELFEEDMPYLNQDLYSAFEKLEKDVELTDAEQSILAARQKVMDAVTAADVLVFAYPLWNLTIPAKLQTFIDYIYVPGYAFKYDEQGNSIPLLTDKKVILLNARGGDYSTPEMMPLEMAVNYMHNALGGTFGMQIIDEVIIEGHAAMPDKAEQLIQEGLNKVTRIATEFAYETVK